MELFEEKNTTETSALQIDMKASPSFSQISRHRKKSFKYCAQPLVWTRRERGIPWYCITEI